MRATTCLLRVQLLLLLVIQLASMCDGALTAAPPPWPGTDATAPLFHVSPAGCRGGVAPLHHGWTNDPNGPFEFKGVHHVFWQSRTDVTGPEFWGHAAGNLSHWHCMPAAIAPGVDYDGTNTPYDAGGVWTGSVTVVNDVPIATYPGEPGDRWCDASPLNLSDPLLTTWKKSTLNPLGINGGAGNGGLGTAGGPLGCTGAWKEASGNWTTTIQTASHGGTCPGGGCPPNTKLRTAFFTSHNFVNWSFVGLLNCPECDAVVTPCCDFYPVNCSGPDCANPGGNRWIFGVNDGNGIKSGAITGTFDRATLTLTPDRPHVATNVYGYGNGGCPKTYVSQDGRRISYKWIINMKGKGCNGTAGPSPQCWWWGMQSVPTVLSPAAPDDITNTMVANPVAELAALRVQPPLANMHAVNISSGGGKRGVIVPGVSGRSHYDALVTFKGLSALSQLELEALTLQIHVFAPETPPGSTNATGGDNDDPDDPSPIQSWQGPKAAAAAGGGGGGSAPPYQNNTDIQSADLRGFNLPNGTTDEEGIAACTAGCLNTTGCAAWVYCTVRFGSPPRCALKGESFACPIAHANTIAGTLPGHKCGDRPHPPPGPPPSPVWVEGQINGGPLALRTASDSLEARVLVDGSVIESYWDGGRARYTARSYPPPNGSHGLWVSASNGKVTADIMVYEMDNAWLAPVLG